MKKINTKPNLHYLWFYGILFFSNVNPLFAQTPVFAWAREGMGTGVDDGTAITVDVAGNVYTTGNYESTVDFDPGAGVVNLTSVGNKDVFIMKSDASGNLLWVKSIGGTGDDQGSTIAVDASGNVYIGGDFSGTADFDPGAGTVNLTQTQSFYIASFVLKLNSSGNFVWVKQFGGVTASVRLDKIILDATGNVLATGSFVGTQDFDPNAGTVNLTPVYEDLYILKLTNAGLFSWAKQIKGVNSLDYAEGFDMETDPLGNIVVVGIIHGTFDFDPGAGIANSTTSGFGDSFVAKYTSAGIYIWSGITGGTTGSVTVWNSELAIDASGYLYVTNYCSGGIVDFDITASVNNINITGSKTSIQKLTPSGNLVWVKILATSSWSVPVCVRPTGIFISSYFSGTVDFNPGAAVFNLTSTVSPFPFSNNDCYLLNLDTAGNFISAVKYGSRFNDYVEDLWMDAANNIYTTGNFYGDGDFDPGAGTKTLYSNGATDIFIQKLNNAGTFQWANGFGGTTYHYVNSISKNVGTYASSTGYFDGSALTSSNSRQTFKGGTDIMVNKVSTTGNSFDIWYAMGGPGNDAGTGIVSDASDNIYVTGYFQQTADFAPTHWDPSFLLSSAGNKDIFILKINSTGDLIWAKRIGAAADEEPFAIALDNSGNLYVTGYYQGTVDFNPGIGLNSLTSAGSLDAFVLKMDTAGNYLWAKSLGGTSSDLGNDVTVDAAGNVLVTGTYNATADFDPGAGVVNLSSAGNIDAFIVKLNSAGVYVWAKSIGGTANDKGNCITTDPSNNVIVAGTFGFTVDFNPGAGIFNLTAPSALSDVFLLQLNSAGNFSWARSFGGPGIDNVTGITTDIANNIYTSGTFNGTADFNPRATSAYNISSNGATDAFIHCFNAVQDTFWVKTLGGTGSDDANGVAVNSALNVFTMGNFMESVDFNPDAGVFNLVAMGASDIYSLRLNQTSPLPIELLSFTATPENQKNILCNWTTASEINNDYFIVERSKDGLHFEGISQVDGAGNSNTTKNYSFTDSNPYRGLSYYRIKQVDFNGQFSYSKVVAVKLNEADENFVVYPNPAKTNLNILFSGKNQSGNIKIFDLQGGTLISKDFNQDQGSIFSIDISKLNAANYYLQIIASGVIVKKKINVIK